MDFPIDPKLILDHILDGLVMVDKRGRILWCNDQFRRMIGREDEELTGRSCCELGVSSFCESHCPAHTGVTGSCGGTEAHFNVQVDAPEGKGEPGAYCFVTTAVKDKDGVVIGHMENFRGMDRVRDVILQLEEVAQAIDAERQKGEELIDSIADGVFSVDRDRTIRRFSSNMSRMLGVSSEDALGRPCNEVLRGSLCETDCPLLWSRDNGAPVTDCREELTTADGRSVPVTISTGFLGQKPDFERGLFGIVSDRTELEQLRTELEERREFHGLVGKSASMRALYNQVEAVAPTDATVLIRGESGTGKELVARAIHRCSRRAQGPFVSVNCAALVDDLLESELFGHVKGSFTGAVRDHRGKFEQAAGGTLFLDEVGDTSPALQAKLLRALQERVIEPVGSGQSREVDVRIVGATNQDLERRVTDGRFREDLYYRLNVIPIGVAPLRERRGDVPLLIHEFLRRFAKMRQIVGDSRVDGVSERALALMQDYPWPGNVRELEHAVEYSMITSTTGRIERAFLPETIRRGVSGLPPRVAETAAVVGPVRRAAAAGSVAESGEGAEVLAALESHRWSIGDAARELGISRTTLWRRMKRLGLNRG